MKKAISLQREQRYEDSIAQLDLLLAIDPHHEQAKLMHQTLKDMVSYRQQLDVQAKKQQQTLETRQVQMFMCMMIMLFVLQVQMVIFQLFNF